MEWFEFVPCSRCMSLAYLAALLCFVYLVALSDMCGVSWKKGEALEVWN
jgi:hypothetical protein